MKKIRIILVIFVLLNIIPLSGCWDMREINEIGLVTAVAIDKGSGENKYSVTVQLANPTSENSSGSESKAKSMVWIGSQEGASLFDATRELVKISSRRIMWAHNNVVIIGESLAKEGIIPVVDYFSHNPELRMKAAVVIAKGDAKDYLVSKIGMENPSGIAFVLLESYMQITAETVQSRMIDVTSTLKSEYGNPMISEVNITKSAMLSESDKQANEKYTETIALEGTAVFKKDKMVGELTPEESRGIAWVLNQTHNTVVAVIDSEHDNKSIAVETEGVKAKIYSQLVGGIPRISVHITGTGDIVEEDGNTNETINEMKDNITRLLNKRIEEEVKRSMKTVQKRLGIDCLGFADIVHKQNNKEWHEGLDKSWREVFPKVPVTVSVDIDIRNSTLNQEPMKVY